MIPSESSGTISFGVVQETPAYNELNIPNETCPFYKRKKVQWFKEVSKYKLDPNIFRTIFVHRTITQIDPIAIQAIDRTLSTFFIKNNEAHLVVNIKKENDLNAIELFKSWLEIFELTDEFAKEENLNLSTKGIRTKLNLNSPGTLELISDNIYTITIIALILSVLAGANIKVGNKLFTFEISSDGLIKKISNFLSDGRKRDTIKELNKKLENLEIDSEQMGKLLAQVLTDKKDDNNQNIPPPNLIS